MKAVFVYGTLLNDEVLRVVLGRSPVKHDARLQGYKRVAVLGETYPAIRPDKDSEVEGALMLELSERDLARLDEYEGRCYERTRVLVCGADGVGQPCMTYVFRPEYFNDLSNGPWCNKRFRKKHLRQFLREISSEC